MSRALPSSQSRTSALQMCIRDRVNYDRNGNPVYTLTEKIPNGNELCFYQNVSFTDTGVKDVYKRQRTDRSWRWQRWQPWCR